MAGTSRLTTAIPDELGNLIASGTLVALLTATITGSNAVTYPRYIYRFPIRNGQAYQPDGLFTTKATVPATETATPVGTLITFYKTGYTDDRLKFLLSALVPEESGGNPVVFSSLIPVANPEPTKVTALPVCTSSYQGITLLLEGTTGQPDTYWVGLKIGDDTYQWGQLI